MRFHYDITGAAPVIREHGLYIASNAGTVAGQALAASLNDATDGAGEVVAATGTTCVNIMGVASETVSDGTSVVATGAMFYQKLIVNPFAVYLAEAGAENGTTGQETSGSSTGEVVTDTFSANNSNAWIYFYGPSGNTADGNIIKVGAITSTTDVTNVTGTAYDDELGATTTDSTFIMIPSALGGGVTEGAVDLNTACTKVNAIPAPTGAAIVSLENYISSKSNPLQPLRVADHCGKKIKDATFYVDLMFSNHQLAGNALD